MDRVVFKEIPIPMEIPIFKTIEKEVVKEVPVERVVKQEVPVHVDRIVERYNDVEVQKVVTQERVVEVPTQHVVIKEVPVYVDKIIYQDVVVEVEKVVVKEVPITVGCASLCHCTRPDSLVPKPDTFSLNNKDVDDSERAPVPDAGRDCERAK